MRGQVPYIVSWSSEQFLPATVVDRPGYGIAYTDEILADRDQQGVLWQRKSVSPGQGRPQFGQIHPLRQRRAMRRLLCGICGGPPDQNEQGMLWLVRDFRGDWPGWPEGMAVTEPPVCLNCARLSARLCPELRKGFVALRVGRSAVTGVRGVLYQGGPSEINVALDDPTVRWVQAAHLLRQLTECTITELAE
jgi:hypothetical protein